MTTSRNNDGSRLRPVLATLIGLVGALIIWVVTPYNNFVLGNGWISDTQLPLLALFLILFVVLVLNPLTRALAPRLSFDARHLALAAGIMLMASLIPSGGALQRLTSSMTRTVYLATTIKGENDAHQKLHLPPSLYPDPLVYGAPGPNANNYVNGLPKNGSVPWSAWIGPFWSWGSLLFAAWMMMIGMSMIVLPQWRVNERLPFPLLSLEQALLENPDEGKWFAPLFRMKSFWIAAGVVFLLHLLEGLAQYFPNRVPAIPLAWNLSKLFATEPWSIIPGSATTANICVNRLYFLFLGFTYFMPNRISFSIWFAHLAYALYVVVGTAYMPPFSADTITDHRTGAMLLVAGSILWLGRKRWRDVGRAMLSRPRADMDVRDNRAGWMFCLGLAGMFAWMVWVGIEVPWALYFLAFIFIVALVVSRILAETGIPFVQIQTQGLNLMYVKLVGIGLITPAAMFFNFVLGFLFVANSYMSAAGMSSHALALDNRIGGKAQARLAYGFLAVLAIGLLVGGAVTLVANYHPHPDWAIANWAATKNSLFEGSSSWDLGVYSRGQLDVLLYNQFAHISFGVGAAGVLQWLCLKAPAWPIHPIGLLLTCTTFVASAWPSIFFGWLSKITIVWIGGASLYRAARPVFIGLIMGELIAAIIWFIVPIVLTFCSLPAQNVTVLPRPF